MARTQKNTVKYFPHDSDAAAGDTLTVLQARFGNDGYAFWFKLLEKLARTEGHYLDCRNSNRWQLLLATTGVNDNTGVEIMNLLVEMEAIDRDLWNERVIWCQKLVDNIADVYGNRRREVPQKPISTTNNPITTEKSGISTGGNAQTKLNETKLNEIKRDTPPNPPKSSLSSIKEVRKDTTIEDVLELYRDKVGDPSEGTENHIKEAVNKLSAAWVMDAINLAASRNKKDWNYIAGILKNWGKWGKVTKDKCGFRRQFQPSGTYDDVLRFHQERAASQFTETQ